MSSGTWLLLIYVAFLLFLFSELVVMVRIQPESLQTLVVVWWVAQKFSVKRVEASITTATSDLKNKNRKIYVCIFLYTDMYEVHTGIAHLLIFGQYNCLVEDEECVYLTSDSDSRLADRTKPKPYPCHLMY